MSKWDCFSTLKDIRVSADCKHCNTHVMNFTSKELLEHISEHRLKKHFKNIRVYGV